MPQRLQKILKSFFFIIVVLQAGLWRWLWTWSKRSLHGKSLTAYEETTNLYRISLWWNCKMNIIGEIKSRTWTNVETRSPASLVRGASTGGNHKISPKISKEENFLKYKDTLQHDWYPSYLHCTPRMGSFECQSTCGIGLRLDSR